MRGTPYFGNLEVTCADRGLSEIRTGNRGELLFSRPAEDVPLKKIKTAQQIVSEYWVTLNKISRVLPQM
jgi:hypothetical protein